jgi:small-conductance mechanosensitive channel
MPESLPQIYEYFTPSGSGMDPSMLRKLLLTLLVLSLVFGLRMLALRFIDQHEPGREQRYRWRRIVGRSAVGLAALLMVAIWFEGSGNLLTYLGLLSAGLAIALRDPLTDLAGWAFILVRKPFTIGDRIEIDAIKGDVIDQRLMTFSMMELRGWADGGQSTGRVVHIPNARVLQAPLYNATQGFAYIWHEIEVQVTFESDWRKAKAILEEVVDRVAGRVPPEAEEAMHQASSRFLLAVGTLTPKIYTSLRDSGVALTARYLSPARGRRGSEEQIVEALLDAFADEPGIDLAYPTQRVFFNSREGKAGTGGPIRSGSSEAS